MESELQSAPLRISFVVTPAPAAAETEAPLTECPEKILASMPAIFRTSRNQQAIDAAVTAL